MKAMFFTACGCSQLREIAEAKPTFDLPMSQIVSSFPEMEYDYKLQGRTRRFKLVGLGYFPGISGTYGDVMMYREWI